MPQIATARSPQALAHSVATALRSGNHRYLVAISIPPRTMGGDPLLALYSGANSCTDAQIEAMTDYPNAGLFGEYEKLPRELVGKMQRRELQESPVAKAMRSLGLVKPDGTPLN